MFDNQGVTHCTDSSLVGELEMIHEQSYVQMTKGYI